MSGRAAAEVASVSHGKTRQTWHRHHRASAAYRLASIAAGGAYVVALLADGSLRAWGENFQGQLGDGTNIDRSSPVVVTGIGGVVAIRAGSGADTLALRSDGTLWAWGNLAKSNVPVLVDLDTTPPPQGNLLLAVRSARDARDVHMTFFQAPAPRWRLFRDPTKAALGTTPLVPDALVPELLDVGALDLTGSFFYDLRGASACSLVTGP